MIISRASATFCKIGFEIEEFPGTTGANTVVNTVRTRWWMLRHTADNHILGLADSELVGQLLVGKPCGRRLPHQAHVMIGRNYRRFCFTAALTAGQIGLGSAIAESAGRFRARSLECREGQVGILIPVTSTVGYPAVVSRVLLLPGRWHSCKGDSSPWTSSRPAFVTWDEWSIVPTPHISSPGADSS